MMDGSNRNVTDARGYAPTISNSLSLPELGYVEPSPAAVLLERGGGEGYGHHVTDGGTMPPIQFVPTEPQDAYYSMSKCCKVILVTVCPAKGRHYGMKKDREKVMAFLATIESKGHVHMDCNIVESRKNSWKEVLEVMAKVSEELGEEKDYKKYSGLICFVLGRGLESCPDSEQLGEIWKPFCNPRCRSLIGKPKLFFIQGCKDRKKVGGNGNGRMDVDSSGTTGTGGIAPGYTTKLPIGSNLGVFLPVLADYGGEIEESTQEPSRFIQALLWAVSRNAAAAGDEDDDDLCHLIRSASARLSSLTEPTKEQMIQRSSSLLHKLKLF